MTEENTTLVEFLDALRRDRKRVVPVTGAGLFVEAGAMSSSEVAQSLRTQSEEEIQEDAGLYEVADLLEELKGTRWVQDRVAEAVCKDALAPTPPLRALVHVPSGIVVTTNYEYGIETAAEQAGIEARPFLLDRVNEALESPPPGVLHVIHVHGLCDYPESIVLTRRSYEEALEDGRMQYALRFLASQKQLLFLGHSLDERERPLRRDLTWSKAAFETTGPHFLLIPTGPTAQERQDFLEQTAVEPVVFIDPSGSFAPVRWAAQVVGGNSTLAAGAFLTPVNPDLLVGPYVHPAVALHDEVSTRQDRDVWQYTSRMRGGTEISLEDVESLSRSVIIGEGGYGKTQMLYELGERSGHQAPVFIPLGAVGPPAADENPIDVFVSWSQYAQSLSDGVPIVTRSVLEDGACSFLLDGLDQVKATVREEIARTVLAVCEAYPQHRFAIASRRIPEAVLFRDAGFTLVEIVPRDDWLVRYAEARGLDTTEINKLTSAVPAIADLLRIPLFGAAAVDRVVGGENLPETALELVEVIAERGLDSEELRLRADPDAVSVWLNRIALTLELAGVSEISRTELLNLGLESGLGIGSSAEVIDHLITRALLAEAGGTVRFAANVVQEARAARTLLNLTDGLDVVRQHVVVDLAGVPSIRASWTHTVDLLLTAAPTEWREEISRFDPLTGFRALSPNAPKEERTQGLETLWRWYGDNRIWFPRDAMGELLDDEALVRRLSSSEIDERIRDEVRASTSDNDEIVRGNAIYFLSAIGDAEGARNAIPRLIADSNSVVRRHAAVVAADLELKGVADSLKEQMTTETDELAEETIGWSLMKLMDDADIGDFVLANSTRKSAWRLWSALDDRWDRSTQLLFLSEEDKFSLPWFDHLINDESGWSEEEVALAARLHFSRADHVRATLDARKVFGFHPKAALREGLNVAKTPADVRELYFLIGDLSDAELEELADRESNEAASKTLHEFLQWRRAPKPTPDRPERPSKPSLRALIEEGNSEEIVRTNLAGEVGDLTDDERRSLSEIIDAAWRDVEQVHGVLSAAITETNGQFAMPRAVMNVLSYASSLKLPLTEDRWIDVVRLPFGTHEYTEWLKETFVRELIPRLIEIVDDLKPPSVERLVLGTPSPWPEDFARAVARRVYGGDVEEWAKSALVVSLEASDLGALLRELAESHSDDFLQVALVRLGDCEVEAELLGRLRAGEELMPRSLADRSNHWLEYVRCPSSVDLLAEVITEEFGKAQPESRIELLYGALNRSAGEDALAIYDTLARSDLEAAGFFWYPKARWARTLSEEKGLALLPGELHEIARFVMTLVEPD